MYIAMPSPLGTNKAGLFVPASRFAAAAAYDSKRGLSRRALRAYDQLATSPNSGQPWNLADDDETAKYGLGRSGAAAEDDEDDETNGEGEHPAHEILRRARASLNDRDCQVLKSILGRMLMAEKDEGRPEEEAAVPTEWADEPQGGDKRRRMGRDRDEPLPRNAAEGGAGGVLSDKRHAKDVRRAQDAAWQHYLAYDDVAKRRVKEQADFAERYPEVARIKVDTIGMPLPRNISARHAAPTPRIAFDAAADRDFAERFPEVARIKRI